MKHNDKSKKDLIAELEKSLTTISQLEDSLKSQKRIIEESDCKKQLQKALNDLKEKEIKYNKVFDNVQDIYYQADMQGILTEISPSVERYSGYKPEEVLGKRVEMVYNNPADRARLMKAIKEKGEVIDFEIQLRSKEGKVIPTSTNARILLDAQNKAIGIEGYLRDISERKKSESLLFATKNRLRVALDLAKIGSWEYDVESDQFTFDDQFYSIYGTTVEREGSMQMSSKDYASKFVPLEEASVVSEEIERLLTTANPNYSNQLEHSIIRADGEKRLIVVRNTILKDETGKTVKVYGANQDITEQRRAEEALKKSEEKYRKIFDNVQDVFYQTDLAGKITEISPSIKRYSGYSREELIGQPVEMVYVNPEDRQKMLKILLDKGEIADYEIKVKNIHGKLVYASVNSHIILDPQNKAMGVEGSLRSITERKIAELALKKSEEKFRTIFENTGTAMALFNTQGVITLMNSEMENFLGCSKTEVENKETWMKYVHPDDIQKMLEYNQKRAKDPRSVPNTYETRFIDYEGKVHFSRITVDKIPGTDEYISSIMDITDLVNAYQTLEESETRFRSLFENNPVPYQSLDIDGKYIDLNEQLSQLLGYSREEILGKSFKDFWTKETIDQFEERFDYLKDHGWINNVEIDLIRADGEKKTILLTGRTQNHPKTGKFQRTHCILYDISERKLMEEKLKRSLEEKEMLIKEIHHRVKNNLMVISSLLNLESHLIQDKEARDVFKESQKRADSMAMIHERLYSSADLKRIDFGDYIRNLSIDLFHTYILDPSQVKLNINVESEMIDIDTAVPLGLIVNEMVTNSMKYAFPEGKNGEINIYFQRIDDDYMLRVKDNGVGIPDDVDLDNTKTLGLKLITSLTRQINGKLELNRDHGTDFQITFKEKEYQSRR